MELHLESPSKKRKVDHNVIHTSMELGPEVAMKNMTLTVSSLEEMTYYRGMFSPAPILIARSSTHDASPENDIDLQKDKRVSRVGRHSIVEMYDLGLRGNIRRVLDDKAVKWHHIDVVRVGVSINDRDNPVVVLVSVPANTDRNGARAAADLCHEILKDHKLGDVHVELLASRGLQAQVGNDGTVIPDLPYETIPRLGSSIGVRGDDSTGSLGVYVNVKMVSGRNVQAILTNHHVVVPVGQKTSHSLDSKLIQVSSPSDSDHKSALDYLRENIRQTESTISKLKDKNLAAQQGVGPSYNQADEKNLAASMKDLETDKASLAKISSANRHLGTVLLTSGLNIDHRRERVDARKIVTKDGVEKEEKVEEICGNITDWGLVELDSNRFRTGAHNIFPELDLRPNEFLRVNKNLSAEDRLSVREFGFDGSIAPVSELRKPKVFDTNDDPILPVIKYGRTTGWTVSVANEILSCCQRAGLRTVEWAIIGDDKLGGAAGFNDGGDSGSCVFDYTGRILGLIHLTGYSFEPQTQTRLCYATPWEWMLDDMKSDGVEDLSLI